MQSLIQFQTSIVQLSLSALQYLNFPKFDIKRWRHVSEPFSSANNFQDFYIERS